MNSKTLERLQKVHTGVDFLDYPKCSRILSNSLDLHIKVYELMNEYITILDNVVDSPVEVKKAVEPRLAEIECELLKYYIVQESDLVPTDSSSDYTWKKYREMQQSKIKM